MTRSLAQAEEHLAAARRALEAGRRVPGAYRLRRREWRIPVGALAQLGVNHEPPPAEAVFQLPTPRGGLRAWRDVQ